MKTKDQVVLWVVKSEKGYETKKMGVYSKSIKKAFFLSSKKEALFNRSKSHGEWIEKVILEVKSVKK